MEIPVFIVWGHKQQLGALGWTAMMCPNCKCLQPFRVFKMTRTAHVYFLEYTSKDIGIVAECHFCTSTFAFPANHPLQLDAGWTRPRGLKALAASTNPELQPRTEPASHSQNEVIALLTVLEKKGGLLGRDITDPFVLGAITSGLICCAGAVLLHHMGIHMSFHDAFSAGTVGLLGGGVAGGVIWAFLRGRQNAYRYTAAALKEAMYRHQLKTGELREALRLIPLRLPRIAHALDSL